MNVLLGILMVIVFTVTSAIAESPNVTTIVKQMKEVFEPSRPSTRKVVVTSSYKIEGIQKNETIQFVAGQARKMFPDGKRIIWIILEPEHARGTAYLFSEREKQPNLIVAYFPFIRRVREFLPVELYDRFLETNFTYADLGFVRLHEHYKLLGEENLGGIHAYKVEERLPHERLYYSHIYIWVAADSFLPLQRNYYDTEGRLWKTELFKEVATINNVPTPLLIEMKDRDGYSTYLKVTEVQYDVKVPDELFNPNLLQKAVDSPLWKGYGSQATKDK
jgi:outer membrane lipoprotein-sorting protein